MADKRKEEEFTVADRRRFSFEDGEVHDNPDRATEPVKEEVVRARDPKAAAWASFVQALFGSAEFRYLK